MLYTIGKTEAYESYIKSCLQINIKPEKRKGGTVWLSIKDVISYLKECYPENDKTKEYTIYGVVADWGKDTKLPEWSGLESERKTPKYRELIRDAEIKKIEIEIETDKEEKNKKEELEITFKECSECSKKPGSPLLCDSCINNRKVISDLQEEIRRLKENTIDITKNTISELIILLGDSFRGLWKSYNLDENDEVNIKKWTVTFIYKKEIIESPEFDTGKEALIWAADKVS